MKPRWLRLEASYPTNLVEFDQLNLCRSKTVKLIIKLKADGFRPMACIQGKLNSIFEKPSHQLFAFSNVFTSIQHILFLNITNIYNKN